MSRYTPTYRQNEIKTIAHWIEAGDSGAVVGLAGSGKSNLFNFLSRQPEALQRHFLDSSQKVVPIPIDLNNLPSYDLCTFYRLILRAFAESSHTFEPELQQSIQTFYRQNRRGNDPFLPQSSLRELLLLLQTHGIRVVWLMDRFDHFCELFATPQMFDTLRGLRDSFKETLCYVVGMRQEVAYLSDPCGLGDLYELLDSHTCWIGAMQRPDALKLIEEETRVAVEKPIETEKELILDLAGSLPILLKGICCWWRTTDPKPPARKLIPTLLVEPGIQNRLAELWTGLTQEEQLVLSELEKWHTQVGQKNGNGKNGLDLNKAYQDLVERHYFVLMQLAKKGLCQQAKGKWCLNSKLLAAFVAEVKERGRGRVWYDEATDTFWQGAAPLDLAPQHRLALRYFLLHPRKPLTKTKLLVTIWPDEWEDVNEDRLYQLIRQLRQKIEINPAYPVYLVNWRGKPEGGYQFFPEGRTGRSEE